MHIIHYASARNYAIMAETYTKEICSYEETCAVYVLAQETGSQHQNNECRQRNHQHFLGTVHFGQGQCFRNLFSGNMLQLCDIIV